MIDWSMVVTNENKQSAALVELKKKVTLTRYNNEVRGITVQGIQVDTGRDSQGLIAGACLAAVLDPNYSVSWKCPGSIFINLNAQQIIGVATAVRAHVQSCFDRERELLESIDDGTFTEEMLGQGW